MRARYYFIAVALSIAASISNPSFFAGASETDLATDSLSSAWEEVWGVDEFGDQTDDTYFFGTFKGSFSNTATTGSDLKAEIVVDSQCRVYLTLLEYNDHYATYLESDELLVKTKVGDVVSEYIPTGSAPNSPLKLPEEFKDSLYSGVLVKVVAYIGSSSYSFQFDSGDYCDFIWNKAQEYIDNGRTEYGIALATELSTYYPDDKYDKEIYHKALNLLYDEKYDFAQELFNAIARTNSQPMNLTDMGLYRASDIQNDSPYRLAYASEVTNKKIFTYDDKGYLLNTKLLSSTDMDYSGLATFGYDNNILSSVNFTGFMGSTEENRGDVSGSGLYTDGNFSMDLSVQDPANGAYNVSINQELDENGNITRETKEYSLSGITSEMQYVYDYDSEGRIITRTDQKYTDSQIQWEWPHNYFYADNGCLDRIEYTQTINNQNVAYAYYFYYEQGKAVDENIVNSLAYY